jgi:hypothetical protein
MGLIEHLTTEIIPSDLEDNLIFQEEQQAKRRGNALEVLAEYKRAKDGFNCDDLYLDDLGLD